MYRHTQFRTSPDTYVPLPVKRRNLSRRTDGEGPFSTKTLIDGEDSFAFLENCLALRAKRFGKDIIFPVGRCDNGNFLGSVPIPFIYDQKSRYADIGL